MMPYLPSEGPPKAATDRNYDSETDGPGLADAFRFLYRRRIKLLARFLVFFGLCLVVFLYIYFTSPRMVGGTLALNFTGIENQEYPSGKKFSVEDFRSPDLLTKAMADAGVSGDRLDLRTVAAHTYVIPVIPSEIQSRWKKQERDGTKKEQYSPNEFKLEIVIADLTDEQRLRLFDAIIKRYQERVKYDQKEALGFVTTGDVSYDTLATIYDFWDIPTLFGDTYRLLNGRIKSVTDESLEFQDPKFQLAFREVAKDLNTWYATRLMAVEALTYQGRLVKNRDIMTMRVQYRIEDLDIQIRQKTQEAAEAVRLLEVIDRPKAALAGQLGNREGVPMVDANVLERLIKSDYVGPVVERISKLQEEIQIMQAEKGRLQRQLEWLPKSTNLTLAQLPPDHRGLIETLSSELKSITAKYNRLLDEYLTASITSKVLLVQSPVVSRGGYSPLLILLGIVALSAFAALFYVAVEHMVAQARKQEFQEYMSKSQAGASS
jgi:hypothetical protein